MKKTLKNTLKTFAITLCVLAFGAPLAQAEDVAITTDKGLKLSANLVLADGAGVQDGVVLLTHGTLAHNRMEIIETLQGALAERGISSLAPTLSLGVSGRTGMYDCSVTHTHKHTDALDEIGLWLDWLKDQGATEVVLAGHSRGGNQTAWFAAREPDPVVSKVILIAPATWDEAKAAAGFEKAHGQPLDAALKTAWDMVYADKGGEVMKGVGVLYCPGADVTAESFVSYYQPDDRRHTPALMGMISKPTLVIAGTEDKVVEGLIEATRPLADAGKVELVVIDGAGHFFLDFFAEDAADAMEAFIAE